MFVSSVFHARLRNGTEHITHYVYIISQHTISKFQFIPNYIALCLEHVDENYDVHICMCTCRYTTTLLEINVLVHHSHEWMIYSLSYVSIPSPLNASATYGAVFSALRCTSVFNWYRRACTCSTFNANRQICHYGHPGQHTIGAGGVSMLRPFVKVWGFFLIFSLPYTYWVL